MSAQDPQGQVIAAFDREVNRYWIEERGIEFSPEKRERRTEEVRSLLVRYYALPASADRFHLSRIAKALYFIASDLRFSEVEVAAVMGFLEHNLDADPSRLDGRSLALRIRTERMIREVSAQGLRGDWQQLGRDYPTTPKGVWIRIEVGRQLVSKCGDAAAADQVLTQAILELHAMPDWDESVRQRLTEDVDIWITMPERPQAASRQDALGQALLLRGFARVERVEMVAAMADLSAARAWLTMTNNGHRLVNVDHNLASVWLQLGDYDRAIETARRASTAYADWRWEGWDRFNPIKDMNGINAMSRVEAKARLARRAGDDVEVARRLLAEVVSEDVLKDLPETYCDAVLLLMQAWLTQSSTPLQRGECWARVAPAVTRLERRDDTMRARCRLLRGRVLLSLGEIKEARQELEGALELALGVRHLAIELEARIAQGDCALASRDQEQALSHYEAAAAGMVQMVIDQQLWLMPGALAAFQQQCDELLAGAFRTWQALVERDGDHGRHTERCYALAQRFHGFESWCWLLLARPASSGSESSELHAEQQRVFGDYERLLKRPAGSPRGQRRIRQEKLELERRLDELAAKLAAASQNDANNSAVPIATAASLAQVQTYLRPGELLVECVELPDRALAFVLTRDAVEVHALPSGSSWRAALDELSRWADGRDDSLRVADVAPLAHLAEQLLGIDSWLGARLRGGDVQTLLWSPAGSFSRVPLAALPFAGEALGRRVAIVNVRSGSLLAERGGASSARRREPTLLAFGNPRYAAAQVAQLVQRDLVSLGELSPLPGTAREVLELGKLFADDTERLGLDAIDDPGTFSGQLHGRRYRLLLGDEARKEQLTAEALAKATVLHFACHGHVDRDAPSMSALALSIDADDFAGDATGGLLHLSELARLQGDFELVTLSACESDRGAARSHASETSLAWAAQIAGARRVLATRWKISDQHAGALVPSFYRRWLVDGLPAARALQQVIVEADGRVPVREWAALTLWGDPR